MHNKFQPRWLSGDNRGQKRQQDERIHLSWSSAVCSRFVKWLNRTKRSTKPPFFLSAAFMVPPRSAASQICATDCRSQSYLVRLLRRQFSLEKSGCQAPPRKQKAKGGASINRDAVMNSGIVKITYKHISFCFWRVGLRVIPVADAWR